MHDESLKMYNSKIPRIIDFLQFKGQKNIHFKDPEEI